MPSPIRTHVQELLDYFGKCADCDYPASASLVTHRYPDGSVEHEIVATCGLPCGWCAPVPMTPMARPHGRFPRIESAPSESAIDPPDEQRRI
ncbi:hypothetical protein NONO_c26680 [Nocardia nova SH22a]|uniref:Uncharacterized protein n=1 Tax=Nocardia nova SH22a TaxID=1415166 RepID=W5TDP9_9NOCA|nr:hypothetical protein [Nocardia nova]AHH17460.1 hypothetical protein NONO_c26680 [Nocardia nova SH22a]